MNFKSRSISKYIKDLSLKSRGRIIILTGARQTGKTTLAEKVFGDYKLISMEDPVTRNEWAGLSSEDWYTRYPRLVVDEVQKLPALVETLKAAYDSHPDFQLVLLGSSQITLLSRVRETLAGRAAIIRLYPFTLTELLTNSWEEDPKESRFIRWLSDDPTKDPENFFQGVIADSQYSLALEKWEYYCNWGGMPALVSGGFEEEDRVSWLYDYYQTYLQRDLLDLARLDHLEPFVRAQQVLALKTGKTVNFSELARMAGVSAPTARKFLRYLEISFQVLVLSAYARNPEKRLSKQPKIHFLDPGVLRAILRKRGTLDGGEWESAVASEVFKQVENSRLPIGFWHFRTLDGREVDLLLEHEKGFVAVECKLTGRVSENDFSSLRGLENFLDKPLLAGFVVSRERAVRRWKGKVPLLSLPAAWFLGPE